MWCLYDCCQALERHWFTDRGQCWNVTKAERSIADFNSALYVDKPRSVDVTTFSGPFVLVIVGVIISVIVALAEILYYRQHGRVSMPYVLHGVTGRCYEVHST